jgi:uncharacterized protein (UPF0276 family)
VNVSAHRLAGCGIGLRREHYETVLAERPSVPWFEVISENFMVDGGRPLHVLESVRRDYPVALHGVSLSPGSAEALDPGYVRRLQKLVARAEPALVSDHLCWTGLGGHNSHDLLPLPFTAEAVLVAARKIAQVQDGLGRRILVENVSSYVRFRESELAEWEFVAAVAEEADCHLLLDVNNVYVNSRNHGFDPIRYIDGLPVDRVRQFHVAGHEDHGDVVIDTHDHRSATPCGLYRAAVSLRAAADAHRGATRARAKVLLAEAREAEPSRRRRPVLQLRPAPQLQEDLLASLRGRLGRGPAPRAFWPAAGDVERRWAIYSSGYVARLVEALETDYPAVRRILGEGPFGSLTARYVRRFAPRSFDIGRAGDRLAMFLEEDPLSTELPFLPDLARYEWSLAEAFVAADSVPLAWSDLAASGRRAWPAPRSASARERPSCGRPGRCCALGRKGPRRRGRLDPARAVSSTVLVHRAG